MKENTYIETKRIVLVYYPTCDCKCHEHKSREQPLTDIQEVGCLICEECGEEMELTSRVILLDNEG